VHSDGADLQKCRISGIDVIGHAIMASTHWKRLPRGKMRRGNQ